LNDHEIVLRNFVGGGHVFTGVGFSTFMTSTNSAKILVGCTKIRVLAIHRRIVDANIGAIAARKHHKVVALRRPHFVEAHIGIGSSSTSKRRSINRRAIWERFKVKLALVDTSQCFCIAAASQTLI